MSLISPAGKVRLLGRFIRVMKFDLIHLLQLLIVKTQHIGCGLAPLIVQTPDMFMSGIGNFRWIFRNLNRWGPISLLFRPRLICTHRPGRHGPGRQSTGFLHRRPGSR